MISISGYENQIEIVISDNASTDDTADTIRSFQIKYPWIKYSRNDSNFEAERNFYRLATLATGDYIWIFGDDDKMEREGIAEILSRIEFGYDLVITNYSIWSKDFSTLIKQRGIGLRHDRIFNNSNELMKYFGLHLSYISSVIIKKDIFLRTSLTEYELYAEYGLSFLYATYNGIASHCQTIYIASTLVQNRADNYGNWDWWKYFVTGTSLIFEALSGKGYSKTAIISAKHQVLRGTIIPYLLSMSVRGGNDRRCRLDLMLIHYKRNWLFWFVCLPALFVPTFIARIGKKIVLKVRSMRGS